MAAGPLAGMKVLELAQLMSGPVCGLMLADLGADVIKFEKFPGGDDTRQFAEGAAGTVSAPFAMVNRNKRGVAVNLKHPGARQMIHRMAAQADVVIENYRLGTMDRLGLGYAELAKINPALIYCSVSGFGRTGPMADVGGFDLIAQGYAGLMSVTGEPGGPPLKPGNSVGDINAGLLAAMAVIAAYVHRLKTGEGQFVETSLFEASLQQMSWFAAMYFSSGRSLGASGSAHPLSAPYQAFRTADKWINIGGANQTNWERIAETLGHPEWKTDDRFTTNDKRKANESCLAELIGAALVKQPSAYWIERFEAAGVPAGPINNIEEALAHAQTAARDMVVRLEHPRAGTMRVLGVPVKFSRTPASITRPAPLLGENARAVLGEYGFSGAQIDALFEQGILGPALAGDS